MIAIAAATIAAINGFANEGSGVPLETASASFHSDTTRQQMDQRRMEQPGSESACAQSVKINRT